MSRVLDEEEQEDDRLRARFAAKWNRTESKKLTGNFRKEIAKYNAFLTSAQSADAQVRAKFESHLAAMQMLCSSPVSAVFIFLRIDGCVSFAWAGGQAGGRKC